MKMMKLISALLSCILLFSACGNEANSEPGADANNMAATTGRYLEEKVEFPAFDNVCALEQTAPDTYYVLGWQNGNPVQALRSEDAGATWRTIAHADLSGYQVVTGGAFTPEGSFYINYLERDPDKPEDNTAYISKTAFVDESGITDIESIPELSKYLFGLTATGSGDVLINDAYAFTKVNIETGKTEQYVLDESHLSFGNYSVYGEKAAVWGERRIAIYDIANGETETIDLPADSGSEAVLAVQEDESGFFYCNRDGLYRVTMDGAITEQLIDGSLAGFGMPSATLLKLLVCQDGSFLVLTQEQGSYQMRRYVFDADALREPANLLTVFSLSDNVYIRQAIGMYQTENPDVMVRLQTALPEGASVTLSEAIRTLSTELIAGKGPDIFVLDGLPVESYIQKDVLLDMTSALEEVKADLLPNAANAFKTGDSLYAIPTRVSVPILVGVGVEEIGSLDEFVTWLENQPEKRIGLSNDVIMEQFYPICAVNWFGADGTLDTAAVTADLTDLERFARLSDIVNIGGFSGHSATPIENYTITDILSQAMFWSGEGFAAICGRFSRLEDASPIFSAMDVRGAGSIIPFPAGENGCIIPSGVLGVNAAGGQTEAALDFVRFALEAETQKSSLNTGMSINRSALEAIASSRKAGDFIDSGAVAYDAERVFTLDNYWPTEERMQGVIEMIASANAVSPHDAIIKQIVLEETAGLFTGDRTVEEVVQALTQKVERNLQE